MSETNSFDEKRLTARVNDLAEQCLTDQQPKWTDFLDPAEREHLQAVLGWKAGVRFNSFGGYSKAERRRVVLYPDFYIAELIQPALAYLEIKTAGLNQFKHGDYLGSLMGLGIKREKFGDLLPVESGCQIILVPELVDFVKSNLLRVSHERVEVKEIDSEQLNPPTLKEKAIRSTVASLRLDAIAALGFGESRTRMVKEIKSEGVKVNWKTVSDPDYQLTPGDLVSIRGRGRMIFREITGKSKKNRLGVLLIRYL